MVSRVIHACGPAFNKASRPVVVTNGRNAWWVEDPPNLARTLPASSEEAALNLWDTLVTAACANESMNHEESHAPDRS